MNLAPVSIKAVTPSAEISEGPHWQPELEALLYVDAYKGILHRYFPSTGRIQTLDIEKTTSGSFVTFVVPIKDHPEILIIGQTLNISGVKWPLNSPDYSKATATVLASIENGKKNRMNDGKCDPQGRLWTGTMALEEVPGIVEVHKGSLYRFSSQLTPEKCSDKISLSNGMGWGTDKKKMYFIDTFAHVIYQYDYDDNSGAIGPPEILIDIEDTDVPGDLPDGMTVDETGNLWIACYGSQMIICVNPNTKKIIRKVKMPVKNPTSIGFGGDDYSTMYVTSGRPLLSEEELLAAPLSGAVFEIKGLGVRGCEPVSVAVDEDIIALFK